MTGKMKKTHFWRENAKKKNLLEKNAENTFLVEKIKMRNFFFGGKICIHKYIILQLSF